MTLQKKAAAALVRLDGENMNNDLWHEASACEQNVIENTQYNLYVMDINKSFELPKETVCVFLETVILEAGYTLYSAECMAAKVINNTPIQIKDKTVTRDIVFSALANRLMEEDNLTDVLDMPREMLAEINKIKRPIYHVITRV